LIGADGLFARLKDSYFNRNTFIAVYFALERVWAGLLAMLLMLLMLHHLWQTDVVARVSQRLR
tara:strand:+ start:4136 stop:4324 length:189 start_codon:yes stop_codon:yes gene_type:complete